MRRWIAVLFVFLGVILGLPALAFARCAGADLLAALARDDATAYRQIESRATQIRNGRGVFWRVERPGAESGAAPSYLLGTYHDTEIAEDPLDAQVGAALEGARVMLAEVTPEEQTKLQDRIAHDPRFILDLTGPGIAARIDPADRATAEAGLAARGLSLALIDRLRPAILLSILALPQCAIEAMAAGKPVLDAALMARAKGAGVPVIGMEGAIDAIERLEALPREVLDRILVDALLKLDQLEDFRRTSVALYRRGDMGMMQEFTIWASAEDLGEAEARRLYDTFSTQLIAERNRTWLATLLPELERGGAFAAFGALHLPGEDGIVELLRAQGFTVTRLDR